MRWPWSRDPEPASAPPSDAELAEQVDEGFLIAMTGLRLAARNRLVLGALRDRAEFDEAALVAGVRADVATIAAEQRALAARVRRIRLRATGRRGQALHGADFRHGDVDALERRERIALLLLARLEDATADDDDVLRLVRSARRPAMDDMFDAALRVLDDAPHAPDPEREARIEALRDELATLPERDR